MKVIKEILWIIVVLVLAALIQFYIVQNIDYKFIVPNTIFIFISIFYTRIAVDLKNIFFIKNKWFKYFFIVFNLFLFIFIVTRIQKVIILYDVFSISAYANRVIFLDPLKEARLIDYIHQEFLFFGVFALVVIVILNSKLLASFWKN